MALGCQSCGIMHTFEAYEMKVCLIRENLYLYTFSFFSEDTECSMVFPSYTAAL